MAAAYLRNRTPLDLVLPSSKLSSLKDLIPPSWDLDDVILDNNYLSHDDLLWDVRDYTGVLSFTLNVLANHKNTSSGSADPQVQGLVDQIRDLIRRDLFTPAVPLPVASSPVEHLPRAIREPVLGGALPPSEGGA